MSTRVPWNSTLRVSGIIGSMAQLEDCKFDPPDYFTPSTASHSFDWRVGQGDIDLNKYSGYAQRLATRPFSAAFTRLSVANTISTSHVCRSDPLPVMVDSKAADAQQQDQRSAASTFRIAGLVTQAARRFSRSINPPVSFGKPVSSGSSAGQTTSSGGDGETTSKPKVGSKRSTTDYLFSPLMPEEPQKSHK